MPQYKAVIVGLTGIAAARPNREGATDRYGSLPQSHASAYYNHPQTDVVAVCDIRQEMLDAFRAGWSDIWPQMRYCTDYRAMFAETRPEIVSVVTPDHLHAEIVVAAAEGGAKAILCEKPLATTLEDADRMIAAAEANGCLLSVEYTRRWSPAYLKARAMLRGGELGKLRSMTTSLFSKRAMLFRNGAHLIDMLHFLADSDAAWVWGELEEGYDDFDIYRGDGGHDPAREPSASGYIHFANGVRAFYESAKLEYPGAQFALTCDQARIEISDEWFTVTRQEKGPGASGQLVRAEVEVEMSSAPILIEGAVDELVRCLEGKGKLTSDARSARRTLEVTLAMMQSHARGNVRVDLPLQAAL
jgi:predicted dehydrogenase